ncbi:MAG: exodeoxyribonuclease VII large subunit, partial [Clostridia bacterium]|nr:exodeoxyribonuclease VII large subunit [Clostridia bacterium]
MTLTVSQLCATAAALLESTPLRDICVTGEIAGWKRYPSGHCYFTLRDAEARVSAVMFR